MIHYSVAGLPNVHKYGDDTFYVLYTAVFELKKEHYGEHWKDTPRRIYDTELSR